MGETTGSSRNLYDYDLTVRRVGKDPEYWEFNGFKEDGTVAYRFVPKSDSDEKVRHMTVDPNALTYDHRTQRAFLDRD